MHPMLIETESTPNPATLKFLPGRAVMEAGTRDFAGPEEAEASPLASALFSLGDVTGVFFGRDFVSVTIAPGAEWADVKPDVLGIMMDHFLAEVPLFNAASAGFAVPPEDEAGFADDPADADIIEQIKELIETRVRRFLGSAGSQAPQSPSPRGTPPDDPLPRITTSKLMRAWVSGQRGRRRPRW